MAPKPPCSLRSAQLTGQGLAMSKMRNSTSPASIHGQPAGAASSVIQTPTYSSQTTRPGSSIFVSWMTQLAAHQPNAKPAAITAR